MKKKVVLIGAGISGLSCLYFFLKKNAKKIQKVEIFEKEKIVGGVLAHTQKNGFFFEHGAQGVLSSRTNFSSLASELNLTQNISRAESKKAHRSFFIKNRIVRISPTNLVQMFRVNLISIFILIRILKEFFVKTPSGLNQGETVKEFFSRRFGKTFTNNFLAPVMKGIWGGGTSRILMRFAFPNLQTIEQEHKSILKYFFKSAKSSNKQAKKEMLSFEDGMGALPKKLLEDIEAICIKENIDFKLNLKSSFPIIDQNQFDLILYSGQPWKEKNFFLDAAVRPQDERNATPLDDDKFMSLEHSNMAPADDSKLIPILKTSGHAARGAPCILSAERIHKQRATKCPEVFRIGIISFEILKKIPTHTLVVVGIGSSNADIQNRLEGFGALAVENNAEGVLGVICVHSLNPKHVPVDSFLYRVIIGGENMPSDVDLKSCDDVTIIQLAKQYLEKYKLLSAQKTYAFEHVVRHIDYIPLPTEYQEEVIQAVSDLEKVLPGVFFVGNYLMGPAVDTCIAQAHITAEKMSQYLARNQK